MLMIYFNPRSLAGATTQPSLADQTFAISIHAPSRERLVSPLDTLTDFYFNPRSLAGATTTRLEELGLKAFQSTLPRGSDPITAYQLRQCKSNISIHAPSRERLLSMDSLINLL